MLRQRGVFLYTRRRTARSFVFFFDRNESKQLRGFNMRFPQWRRGLSPKITENTLASWPIVGFGTANKEADLARYGGTVRNLIVSSAAATYSEGRTNHAPVDNAFIRTTDNDYFYHNGVGGQDSASLQGSWTISFWAKRTGTDTDSFRNSVISYGGTTTSEKGQRRQGKMTA